MRQRLILRYAKRRILLLSYAFKIEDFNKKAPIVVFLCGEGKKAHNTREGSYSCFPMRSKAPHTRANSMSLPLYAMLFILCGEGKKAHNTREGKTTH